MQTVNLTEDPNYLTIFIKFCYMRKSLESNKLTPIYLLARNLQSLPCKTNRQLDRNGRARVSPPTVVLGVVFSLRRRRLRGRRNAGDSDCKKSCQRGTMVALKGKAVGGGKGGVVADVIYETSVECVRFRPPDADGKQTEGKTKTSSWLVIIMRMDAMVVRCGGDANYYSFRQ